MSLPSGTKGFPPGLAPGVSVRSTSASRGISIFPPGKRPLVSVISAAFTPPAKKPSLNASRTFRVRYRSCTMNELSTSRSYSARRSAEVSPPFSAWKMARAANKPDCIA